MLTMEVKTSTPSLIKSLCDESAFTLAQAIALAQNAARSDPRLPLRILHHLLYDRERTREGIGSDAGRLLDIIGAVSSSSSILPLLSPLLTDSDARVRSRVALLIAKGNRSAKWVERRTAEDDPRVRANAIEGLWGASSEEAQELLRRALTDRNNRVAGNALIGLYLAGAVDCIPSFIEMASSPTPLFRITAAWAMGETGDPRFLPLLARMLAGAAGGVRKTVFGAVNRIKQAGVAAAAGPPLGVLAPFVRLAADGSCRLRIVLTGQDQQPIAGLPATAFIIWEDGVPVVSYSVREQPLADVLTVAFAIPRQVESALAHSKACEAALLSCLTRKRAPDSWIVAKYFPRASAPVATEPGAPPARAAGIVCSSTALTLEESIQAPDSLTDAPTGLSEAVNKILQLASRSHGPRHIVLCQEQNCGAAFASQLAETAKGAGITVNAISMQPDPALEETCHRTFGVFCRVEEPAAIAPALEKLYLTLASHYELTYRPAAPSPQLRVHVHTPNAQGEAAAL
jgi:HEAT repeat protein